MCVRCHTPRNDKGRLIEAENLKEAPVPVKLPEYPRRKWAVRAPANAGLIGSQNKKAYGCSSASTRSADAALSDAGSRCETVV